MQFFNPYIVVAMFLAMFLINMIAQASPNPGNLPPAFAESSVAKQMSEKEIQSASDEWETILEILDAGSDKIAGPGGRATSCNVTGPASFYGPGFHGRRTASGETFNANGITAAHRYLPFGSRVRVTSVATGRSITVRINDRGPFGHGRIIDLSAGAARAIGLSLGKVHLECL